MSGLLRCQLDSYLKCLSAVVVSCDPISSSWKKEFKSKLPKEVSHVVELSDSVLFCEGGGQPSDLGYIDSVPVLYVGRCSRGTVLHFTSNSLEPGSTVEVKLEWNRRFDHMQQHSGQHLLSAIAEQNFGWKTTSWWLGDSLCNVEVKQTKKELPVNSENLQILESTCNQIIRENRIVAAKVVNDNTDTTNESITEDSEDRKSTDRHHGALRVVEIENLDKNACCGTHISHTSELQVIKLVSLDKTRGNFRIFFHVGNRVIQAMDAMLKREAKLRTLLSCGPEEHYNMIKKSQTDHKNLLKTQKGLLAEVAESQAQKLLKQNENQLHRVVSLLREVADISFLSSVASFVVKESPQSVCLLACGDPKGEGMFLLQTSSDDLFSYGKQVAEILGGRGGGKMNRFQGKVKNLESFSLAVESLEKVLLKESKDTQ